MSKFAAMADLSSLFDCFTYLIRGDDDFSSSGGYNINNPPCKVVDKSEIIRILVGKIGNFAAMADILDASEWIRNVEIICVLAGQHVQFAAMADDSHFVYCSGSGERWWWAVVVEELGVVPEVMNSDIKIMKLDIPTPKKFLPIVASIEQYSEIDEMSFEEAMGRIITFEDRIKSQDEPEENYQNKLLMARSSNQNHGNGRGRNLSKGVRDVEQAFNKGMEGDPAAVYGGPTRPRQITRDLNGRTTSPTRHSTKGQWTAEEDETLHTAVKQFKGIKLEENC
ncbi:hypothetical protein Tco_1035478 [Tanacetum coccineum]